MRGYKVTNNSSVTVEANGQTKTFKNGDHVTFPANAGAKQTVSFTGFQFAGSAAPTGDLKDKLVVWMNTAAPAAAGAAAAPWWARRRARRAARPRSHKARRPPSVLPRLRRLRRQLKMRSGRPKRR